MKPNFTIITETEKKFKILQENSFSLLDAEPLIEHHLVFEKFIWTVQAYYRSNLALWLAKWKEEAIYNYVECLEDLKNQVQNLWDKIREFKIKQNNLQNSKK